MKAAYFMQHGGPEVMQYGDVPDPVEVEIEGSRFALDLRRGQKTGFFFDQADNRARLARWTGGARHRDVSCCAGGGAARMIHGSTALA